MTDLSTPRASTLDTVQRVMAGELDLSISDLQPDRQLQELGVDSLGIIEVMFKLEDEFGIRMGDERVPIGTVREIADIVDRLILARESTTP
jgi:acyl carrier protein